MRQNDEYPRHAHRTPSEIAEDETMHALAEGRCSTPIKVQATDAIVQSSKAARRIALQTWADAHPLKLPH